MRRALMLSVLLGCAVAAPAAEVVTVLSWELHSSFWMSLHQRLLAGAMGANLPGQAELSSNEQAQWDWAVGAYRAAGGHGNLTFATPMKITTDALTQVADDAAELFTDAPLKDALEAAAPVYLRHWWKADDRAGRFFIAYAAALLREAGEPLVREHEAVYRTDWPARIRVYITPAAGPFGAYTIEGLVGGIITTMSCRDEGYQGLHALEMLLHEGSHAIVGPNNGTIASAIAAAARSHGMPVPRDLWHALLFATSSELTRRVLAERGVTSFVPSSVDLLTRVWPGYREPIEEHWIAYLDGEGTLEEAVDRIVAATAE